MRRTSNAAALLAFAALSAHAQDQRPLPRGAPDVFLPATARVHVRASEELDPDRLRDLTRPGVTLWLSTRSNTLKASTLENLARFDVAWVQLRAPLKPVDAALFRKVPGVGAWVSPPSLGVQALLPGARRVAVELQGPLDETTFAQLSQARPAEVTWRQPPPIDLLAWGQFRALGGRRIIAADARALLPVKCAERSANDPSLELHVANLLALSSDVFPCGQGTRVVVQPTVETWLLQSLLVRDPSVELVLEIGADSERAVAARGLLDRLQLGPSR
ncbi:MAG: hypothetical protein U0228_12240 [Myxococcaceae bacterium]